ncbi:MAG: recombinase RecA, partial [Ktedonobacterales bacterium]
GQGRENAKEFLRQNPDVAEAIEAQIRAAVAPAPAADGDESDPDPEEM